MESVELVLFVLGVLGIVAIMIIFIWWRRNYCKIFEIPKRLTAICLFPLVVLGVASIWMENPIWIASALYVVPSILFIACTKYEAECSATASGAVIPARKLFFLQAIVFFCFAGILTMTIPIAGALVIVIGGYYLGRIYKSYLYLARRFHDCLMWLAKNTITL